MGNGSGKEAGSGKHTGKKDSYPQCSSPVKFTPLPPADRRGTSSSPRAGMAKGNSSRICFLEADDTDKAALQDVNSSKNMNGSNSGRSSVKKDTATGKGERYHEKERLFLANAIFSIPKGHLECILSGFITEDLYRRLGFILEHFLSFDLREIWFMDTPVFAYNSKEKFDFSPLGGPLNKETTQKYIAQRNKNALLLQEQLLLVSGAAVPRKKGGPIGLDALKKSLQSNPTTNVKKRLARLEIQSTDSVKCLKLLSNMIKRFIPTKTVEDRTTLFEYILPTTSILSDLVEYKDDLVYDAANKNGGEIIEEVNFFMSLAERAQIMRLGANDSFKLTSGNTLYSSMRNAGLIITTACSSMVIHIVHMIAQLIHARKRFRDLVGEENTESWKVDRTKLAEEALGSKDDVPKEIGELQKKVVLEDTPLSTYCHVLVKKYIKEHLGNLGDLGAGDIGKAVFKTIDPKLRENFNYLGLVTGAFFKIMYLVAGGQRSIQADDLRFTAGKSDAQNDVWVSRMLEVPILNRICWLPYFMGMPMMSQSTLLHINTHTLNFEEVRECTSVMRELFIAVGALPIGDKCPKQYGEWLKIFPFYAVNSEAKRILINLYMCQSSSIIPLNLKIPKDQVLISVANQIQAARDGKYNTRVCFEFKNSEYDEKILRRQQKLDKKVRQADGPAKCMNSLEDNTYGYDYGSFRDSNESSSSENVPILTSNEDESDSSVSTLLDPDLPLDIFTCLGAKGQIYIRCSNELAVRRGRQTVISPYSTSTFYASTVSFKAARPDLTQIASAIDNTGIWIDNVEGILVVKWIGKAVVQFEISDLLLILTERNSKGMSRTPSDSNLVGATVNPAMEEGAKKTEIKEVQSGATYTVEAVYDATAASLSTSTDRDKFYGTKNDGGEFVLVIRLDTNTMGIHEGERLLNFGHQRNTPSPGFFLGNSRITWCHPLAAMEQKEETRLNAMRKEQRTISKTKAAENEKSISSRPSMMSPTEPKTQSSLLKIQTNLSKLSITLNEPESMVENCFFAVGVLLGNAIFNGTYLRVPFAPLLFYLIKKSVSETGRLLDKMWLPPHLGNLLHPEYILNEAREVLITSDQAYYEFLEKQGLMEMENLPFAPLETVEEENVLSADFYESGNEQMDLSRRYLKYYKEELVERNAKCLGITGPQTRHREYGLIGNSTDNRSVTLPPIEKTHSNSFAASRNSMLMSNSATYDWKKVLPSRYEYVALYLVNQIAWGNVSRSGAGDKNMSMYEATLRGIRSTLLVDTPLLKLCSARVIREVLCLPD